MFIFTNWFYVFCTDFHSVICGLLHISDEADVLELFFAFLSVDIVVDDVVDHVASRVQLSVADCRSFLWLKYKSVFN